MNHAQAARLGAAYTFNPGKSLKKGVVGHFERLKFPAVKSDRRKRLRLFGRDAILWPINMHQLIWID
jgi:hypothetical protein